jgi:hypothetical protein
LLRTRRPGSCAVHVTALRSGTAGEFPPQSMRGGLVPGARRAATWFSSSFLLGLLPLCWPGPGNGRLHAVRAAPPGFPGGLRRSGRGGALAAAALGGTGGGDASRVDSGPPSGRRAPPAGRGNPGRGGRGRRRRLVEGRRDQLVEFLAQPLRVSADHVRERGVHFTDGQVVHADQTPRNLQ